MIDSMTLFEFALESNKIESIYDHNNTVAHAAALEKLLTVDRLLVTADVDEFVHTIQPDAQFRSLPGLNVRVGNHRPTSGGPLIQVHHCAILHDISTGSRSPHLNHISYETLHPYTDGNGRSGRALWLWQMHKYEKYDGRRLFLHEFYYQTLSTSR